VFYSYLSKIKYILQTNHWKFFGFEVHAAVTVKTTAFSDAMHCIPVDVHKI
jgi:hypothetical protein